jgi:hypothetical protein
MKQKDEENANNAKLSIAKEKSGAIQNNKAVQQQPKAALLII